MEISPFLGALQGYRWSYSEAEVDHTFFLSRSAGSRNMNRSDMKQNLVTVPEETFPFEDVYQAVAIITGRRGHY